MGTQWARSGHAACVQCTCTLVCMQCTCSAHAVRVRLARRAERVQHGVGVRVVGVAVRGDIEGLPSRGGRGGKWLALPFAVGEECAGGAAERGVEQRGEVGGVELEGGGELLRELPHLPRGGGGGWGWAVLGVEDRVVVVEGREG